jgi:capsular polysaccharide biosynthesis protein
MKDVRLMGLNLCPVSEDGYVARESLNHMRFIPSYLVSPERLGDGVTRTPVYLKGKYCSLVNHWQKTPNYYHWLMNVLPKLELYNDLEEDRRILINDGLLGYQIESLKHLGLWEKCIVAPSNHLIVENFLFVPHTSMAYGLNPQAINYLRTGFLREDQKQNKGERKIYLSRKNASRSAVNEDEVNELFRENGWDIVDGAKHTLLEQVDIFSRASHICGLHGAGLLNLIWAGKETRITEFFPNSRMVASNENIAAYLGMDYQPVAMHTGWNYQMKLPIDYIKLVIEEAKSSGLN